MRVDLNSVPLSEYNILGNLNLSIMFANKWITTDEIFLSGMGVAITCEIANCSEGICVILCCGIIRTHKINE